MHQFQLTVIIPFNSFSNCFYLILNLYPKEPVIFFVALNKVSRISKNQINKSFLLSMPQYYVLKARVNYTIESLLFYRLKSVVHYDDRVKIEEKYLIGLKFYYIYPKNSVRRGQGYD